MTSEINLYNTLKNKIGENETKELIEFIDFRSEQKRDKADKLIATKQDINDVRKEISESKADIIKWVAAIILGQTALLITLIKLLK
jgi:hypothetical protein